MLSRYFPQNPEDENVIEFQNVVSYVLKLLRIFSPDFEERPEKILNVHF